MAARQQGKVTRAQLLDAGASPASITRWCRSGRLHRDHAGVYSVGYRRVDSLAVAAAAVLAAGPDAVLSHDSAAALWGLRRWPRLPEVTAPHTLRRAGIVGHRSRTLARQDTTRQHGIRTTTPARTLDDLRPRLSARQLIRLANGARVAKLIDEPTLERLTDRAGRPTRSGFEDDFLAFAATHGLPAPEVNAIVHGHEVDMLYRDQKLIVELDSWTHHRSRRSFASDRERDAALAPHGYQTYRIADAGLTRRQAQRLRATLRRRAP